MQSLGREELAGVIAHELAHIKNRDTLTMTVAATIAGAIGFLGQFAFMFGGSRNGERSNPIAAILVMIFAPLAATIVQMAISRTREFSADRLGAQICGMPRALASALQRIEQLATGRVMPTAEHNPSSAPLFIINPLRLGGVDNLFRTHPRTEDRIRALLALEQEGVGAPVGSVRHGSVPRAGGRQGPWA
jgi:heat shock protein HtpX